MSQVFLLAFATAFYPVLIAIVVLLVARPSPRPLLAALLAGGMVATIGSGLIIVLLLDGSSAISSSKHRTLSPWVDVIVGALSLVVTWLLATGRTPRRRLRTHTLDGHASWTERALRRDSIWLIFLVGIVIDLPSVWYLAALKDIVQGGYSMAGEAFLIVGYAVIAYLFVEIALIAFLVAPQSSRGLVERSHAWLQAHARQIGIVVSGAVGVYLIGVGISGLV